jgi:hypothetical protein
MSHDGTDTLTEITSIRRKSYVAREHHNSNRRRHEIAEIQERLFSKDLPPRDFEKEPVISFQIWRCGLDEGHSLPRGYSRQVLRAHRSKYEPHVGAKQKAKAGLLLIAR